MQSWRTGVKKEERPSPQSPNTLIAREKSTLFDSLRRRGEAFWDNGWVAGKKESKERGSENEERNRGMKKKERKRKRQAQHTCQLIFFFFFFEDLQVEGDTRKVTFDVHVPVRFEKVLSLLLVVRRFISAPAPVDARRCRSLLCDLQDLPFHRFLPRRPGFLFLL